MSADRELDKHRTPEGPVIKVPGKPAPVVSPAMQRYFRAARERLDYLEYGDPVEFLSRMTGEEHPKSQLQSIWVPPRFTRQKDRNEEVNLDTLLHDEAACKLVLGDPGFGKSTLARFLTCFFIERYCSGAQTYFGLYVPLSQIRATGEGAEAVAQCAAKFVGLDKDGPVVTELKNRLSEACVVFDGLDELPIVRRVTGASEVALRREAAELISSLLFVELQPGQPFLSRAIVTCRGKDYTDDRTAHIRSAQIYQMSRFSPPQMGQAIDSWHKAAVVALGAGAKDATRIKGLIENRRQAIHSALRSHPDLAEVCLTPLMLNALQTVFSDANDLPSSVSQLCWRAIKWFVVDKHKDFGADKFVAENAEWLLETITAIGWYLHNQVVAGQPKSCSGEQLRKLTLEACPPRMKIHKADYETKENAITMAVAFIRRGHGILIPLEADQYDFSHNVFREVMAGRALSGKSIADRRQLALNEAWHGPIRYWAGLKAAEPDGAAEINVLVGELAKDAAAGKAPAILAGGEMLVEVCAVVSKNQFTELLHTQIEETRARLVGLLKTKGISIAQRTRIGDLLSVLGDPCLENGAMDRICEIPSGVREIGRATNHQTRIAKYEKCPAAPVVSGELRRFGLSSHLVTNAEFAKFMEDGGYRRQEFWPNPTGWLWSQQDPATWQKLTSEARKAARIHFSSELAGQRLVSDEIPERCQQMVERTQPLYWIDPAYNRHNQPVVGVNWWEAVAYCAWLETHLRRDGLLEAGWRIRLPIEAEWETAARLCGNDGPYPWITGTPAENAFLRGTMDAAVGSRSCAVGLFQSVDSRLPIYDLSGNVWEWTLSHAHPYSADSFKQTVDLTGIDDRIARGSSWLSSETEAPQVTFRSFDPPYNAYEDLGFRIAVDYGEAKT